jgi:hypothetical protein
MIVNGNKLFQQLQKSPLMAKSSTQKPVTGVRIRTEKKFGLEEERSILCANCGNTITTPQSIITVDGHHTHRFTNPAGVTYEIGCFSSADGCIILGDPALVHTWFEDFSWCFSNCSSCFMHLGWYYKRENESFFGLILAHLVDSSKRH